MSASFSAGEFPPTTSAAAHPPTDPLQITVQLPGFLEGTRTEKQQQCQGVLNCRHARRPKLDHLSGDIVVLMLDTTLIYMAWTPDSASPATSVSVKTVHSVLHHDELQSHRTIEDNHLSGLI